MVDLAVHCFFNAFELIFMARFAGLAANKVILLIQSDDQSAFEKRILCESHSLGSHTRHHPRNKNKCKNA
jgi:hypothetical protein